MHEPIIFAGVVFKFMGWKVSLSLSGLSDSVCMYDCINVYQQLFPFKYLSVQWTAGDFSVFSLFIFHGITAYVQMKCETDVSTFRAQKVGVFGAVAGSVGLWWSAEL